MRDVEFGIPKLAHRDVIDIGDAATLDSLPGREAVVSLALIVKIRLEVVVDDFAVRLREAGLFLVVAVSEIVALAARQEVVAVRLVGRFGAAVVGPDEIGGGFGRLGRLEGVHGCVQQESVGFGHACSVAGATKDVRDRERRRERRGKEGEKGE